MEERFGGPHGFINVYEVGGMACCGTCSPSRQNADNLAAYRASTFGPRRIGIWKVYLK